MATFREPLNLGTGFTKDKTVEFVRGPADFFHRSLEDTPARAFLTRLGLRPCLVLASSELELEHSLIHHAF